MELPDLAYTRQFIDLSTAHITRRDKHLLELVLKIMDPELWITEEQKVYLERTLLIVENLEHGFVVYECVAPARFWANEYSQPAGGLKIEFDRTHEHTNCLLQVQRQALHNCGFSEAFVNLMEVAANFNCGLWFDSDAPIYEEWPTFDWEAEQKEDDKKGLTY